MKFENRQFESEHHELTLNRTFVDTGASFAIMKCRRISYHPSLRDDADGSLCSPQSWPSGHHHSRQIRRQEGMRGFYILNCGIEVVFDADPMSQCKSSQLTLSTSSGRDNPTRGLRHKDPSFLLRTCRRH